MEVHYQAKIVCAFDSKLASMTLRIRLHELADFQTDNFVTTKMYWMHRQSNFITRGAQLRTRELRYKPFLPGISNLRDGSGRAWD